jgi:PHD/YefM family antitoxin component YafN of YafNO toxin-antitoxin module
MKTAIKNEPQFITDKKGKKLSVVISVTEYKKMLEELEELEDIRLYDAVKAKNEKSISFSQYLQQRRKKYA